jgi:uncharacterized protein YjbI with pentapeptide repeats
MSAKATAATIDWAAPRLKGKSFVFAGTRSYMANQIRQRLLEAEGGKIAEDVSAKLDFLVAGPTRGGGPSAQEKKATQLIQKGAAIRVLDENEFLELFLPTRDEAIAMLTAGPKGVERWNLVMEASRYAMAPNPAWQGRVDLTGLDFHGANLCGAKLQICVLFDGVDCRDANLSHAQLPPVQDAKFDRASLAKAQITGAKRCSFHEADLTEAYLLAGNYRNQVVDCMASDFTGANLSKAKGSAQFTQAILRNAKLCEAMLGRSNFQHADLSSADLSGARLAQSDFAAAKLNGARLCKADLTEAKFTGADLSKADLRHAVLVGADFTDATIDGADFEGAVLIDANFTALDPSRARALDLARLLPPGRQGPNLLELDNVAQQAKRLQTSITVDANDGQAVELTIISYENSRHIQTLAAGQLGGRPHKPGTPLSAAMLDLVKKWTSGSLHLDSIKVKTTKSPIAGKELRTLVLAAWCEAFGSELPTTETLKKQKETSKAKAQQVREQFLQDLAGGVRGVERWNACTVDARKRAGKFHGVDLSGKALAGANLQNLDFQGSRFAGANLAAADLSWCRLQGADFQKADLTDARGSSAKLNEVNFTEACLKGVKFWGCSLRKANLQKADMREAQLASADLCGANLSSANLDGANLEQAKYDDKTRFPKGFKPPKEMKWAGTGPRPQPKRRKPTGPVDVDTFMKRLEKDTDPAKLSKALAMLKAERFKLFAQLEDDFLVGVVKSQTDPDLVYSCRLGSDGSYGCCTQNLNICGGLRGSPCKHLLVLIIGLTKGGELDPTTINDWVYSSQGRKPVLDKDAMSETFLRYKGAEAGEVDWRPTETIPEDYYAL